MTEARETFQGSVRREEEEGRIRGERGEEAKKRGGPEKAEPAPCDCLSLRSRIRPLLRRLRGPLVPAHLVLAAAAGLQERDPPHRLVTGGRQHDLAVDQKVD